VPAPPEKLAQLPATAGPKKRHGPTWFRPARRASTAASPVLSGEPALVRTVVRTVADALGGLEFSQTFEGHNFPLPLLRGAPLLFVT
jgi:hypothetical protein